MWTWRARVCSRPRSTLCLVTYPNITHIALYDETNNADVYTESYKGVILTRDGWAFQDC